MNSFLVIASLLVFNPFWIKFRMNLIFIFVSSSNAAVRTIRPIKKGEELLDNYGYHYAVMNKGDRQKSL
jgi:hypothetical protein